MTRERVALVLFNLGAPDSPAAIRPFLFNLFNDAAIVDLPQPLRWCLAKLIAGRRAREARDDNRLCILLNKHLVFVKLAEAHPLIQRVAGLIRTYLDSQHWRSGAANSRYEWRGIAL